MTFLWLIVWLTCGVPHVGHWNAWMLSLVICGAMDLFRP